MADPAERQRTVLRAPRVEFDLSALALGAGGWLAYQWSWPALASVLSIPTQSVSAGGGPAATVPAWHVLRWEFFTRAFGFLGLPDSSWIEQLLGAPGSVLAVGPKDGKQAIWSYPLAETLHADLPAWKLVVVAAWLLVLWSIVAGAISRVYALRIARDESIGASDAVAFSLGNLKPFLLAPLFVATCAVLFVAGAAAAGAACATPYAGPFLEVALHPLAFVAGLVAVVLAAGLVFGLPMMQAAVAAERNGALDAVSRTFSYVFTRPVAYVAALAVTTFVAGLLAAFGLAFITIATRALLFGASWSDVAPGTIAAGAEFGLRGDGVLGWPHVTKGEGLELGWIYVSWAVTSLAAIVVNGYVLSYFVGGLTDTYFLLRREVDGIDESEVYTEGDEASLGEPVPGEPRPPSAGNA